MADIFLSYGREDQSEAARLANALEARGKTVWWDRHLLGGADFAKHIERELEAADKVLVLWSAKSISSRWVRDEAAEAADSGRLISASIDGTPPPLGFRQFHCIDLAAWDQSEEKLPAELATALGFGDAEQPPEAPPTKPPRSKGLLLSVLAGLALLLGTLAVLRPAPISDLFGQSDKQSATLAILPFSVSGDAELAHLGKGLAITLSDGMSRLQGLTLISTTSTQAVVDRDFAANEIGDALGVSHFVEGDLRIDGDRLRATLRLIDSADERQVWSAAFNGTREDLPAFERQIGNQLAAAIKARLGLGDGDFRGRGKVDPRAYEAYLKGMEQLSVRFEQSARAETLRQFRLAAQIEPEFAEAHAGIAYILSLSTPFHFPMTFEELMAQQKVANDRAFELDPDNVMAILARANAEHNYHGNLDRSFELGQRALALDPNSGAAHYSMGSTLVMMGRAQEALPHYDRAVAADPFNLIIKIFRMIAYHELQDYAAVRTEARSCASPCPGAAWEWFGALVGYGTRRDYEQDMDAILALGGREMPDDVKEEMQVIARYFLFGEEGQIVHDDGSGAGFEYAVILANFGHVDDAFAVAQRDLDKAQADEILRLNNRGRLVFPEHLRSDPRYHAIFEVPRFKAVTEYRRKAGITEGLPVFPVKQR